MQKTIQIDDYFDGYKSNVLNCVDIPVAACAGFYKRDFYFYYCFCYSFFLNWDINVTDDWLGDRNYILQILGLRINKKNIEERKQLISQIIYYIKTDHPVFMVVKYGALFYSDYYIWGDYDHGLVISDYDDVRNVVGIRDREVIRKYIKNGFFSSDVLHRLQVDVGILDSIWEKSNHFFEVEKSEHYKSIYVFEQIESTRDIGFYELCQKIDLCYKKYFTNRLYKYILEVNEKMNSNLLISKAELENSRRIFCNSFNVIWDLINKYAIENNVAEKNISHIKVAYGLFIDNRNKIFNRFQKNILLNITSDYEREVALDTVLFTNFWKEVISKLF